MEVKSCHDAPTGFGIMQSYDTPYCHDEEALRKEEDHLEEDIYDNESGSLRRFQLLEQVKSEPIEKEFLVDTIQYNTLYCHDEEALRKEEDHLEEDIYDNESGSLRRFQLYEQVKNEPIEEEKREDLKDHIHSVYPANGVIFDVKNTNMEEQHPFKCPECPKSFLQKTKLQRHAKTHSGERPYTCIYCQASFSRSEHLQRHARKHTGERPYNCTLCQSAFTRKEHLQRHIRTHTGERPYQCACCQETFLKKENLQRHFRIHTGERPYQCSYCQESFLRSEHFQRHVQTHKGEE